MRNNVTDSQCVRFMESDDLSAIVDSQTPSEREVIKAATDASPATVPTPLSKKAAKNSRREAAALRAADERRSRARSELQAEFRRHERDAIREDELQAEALAKREAEQRARDDPMVMIRSDDGKVDIFRRSQVWAVEAKYMKNGVQPVFKDLGVLSAEGGRRLVADAAEVNMIKDVDDLSLRGGACEEEDTADEGYSAPVLSGDSTRKREGVVAEKLMYAFFWMVVLSPTGSGPISLRNWLDMVSTLVLRLFCKFPNLNPPCHIPANTTPVAISIRQTRNIPLMTMLAASVWLLLSRPFIRLQRAVFQLLRPPHLLVPRILSLQAKGMPIMLSAMPTVQLRSSRSRRLRR